MTNTVADLINAYHQTADPNTSLDYFDELLNLVTDENYTELIKMFEENKYSTPETRFFFLKEIYHPNRHEIKPKLREIKKMLKDPNDLCELDKILSS